VNKSPVVGELVRKSGGPTVAMWIVSAVSVGRHVGPVFNTPPIHFTIVDPPESRLPVVIASTGVRIVWFALRVMSNPLKASDP